MSDSGIEIVFRNMDRHYTALNAQVDQAVQGAGIDCAAEAKKLCPVGTPESTGIKGYIGGRLRASIQYWRVGVRECKVRTNVKYAPFVEFGTYKMRARPYMFPAYVNAMRRLLEELKRIGVG